MIRQLFQLAATVTALCNFVVMYYYAIVGDHYDKAAYYGIAGLVLWTLAKEYDE